MRLQQRAGRRQLRLRAGGGEARRHAVVVAPLAVPAADQRLALVEPLLGGVEQVFGRVAVHQHLAGDHQRAVAAGLLEEGVHRLGMHGAIDRRRRGAGAQQLTEEQLRHGIGMRLVGELGLRDEGVLVEPGEELLAEGPDHLHLRVMDMRVDEAGAEDGVGVVGDGHPGRHPVAQGGVVAHPRDLAAIDQHERVRNVDEAVLGVRLEGIVPEGDRASA